ERPGSSNTSSKVSASGTGKWIMRIYLAGKGLPLPILPQRPVTSSQLVISTGAKRSGRTLRLFRFCSENRKNSRFQRAILLFVLQAAKGTKYAPTRINTVSKRHWASTDFRLFPKTEQEHDFFRAITAFPA